EPVRIDVEAIAGYLAAARAGMDANAAQVAATLAEPGLLPDLDVPWLSGPRAELEEQRIEALELVARAGGDGAERAARTAFALARFGESARAALIEVLMRRGNVAEAVRAYDDIRVLLREELGTTPGPELVALHERLLAPAPAPAPKQSGLLEREAELAEIAA